MRVSNYQETIDRLRAFRDQRDWRQFHNPKDLAISISLESAELLEAFQWSGANTSADGRMDKVSEELADVLIYCLFMADACGLDPLKIVNEKIDANAEKYPVELSRGDAQEYPVL